MFCKILVFGLLTCGLFGVTEGCTGIFKKAENGDWVYARTLEYDADLDSFNLNYIPHGISFTSNLSPDKKGATWKTKYANAGFSPFGTTLLADGLNEKGLTCGAFYFPGYAEYQALDENNIANTISNLELVEWILGNFESVEEVKNALKAIKVVGSVFPDWGFIPPLHYFVVDKSGDRIVIEYVKGELKMYDTPFGIITNAPTYDWHLTNIRTFIGLKALNDPTLKIDEKDLSQFGQEAGPIGLPGDFTSPSRFIQASFLNEVVVNGKDGPEQVARAFKILNHFDIPRGAVKTSNSGKRQYEETQWTSAVDLSNLIYYFHTPGNREIRSIDLKSLGLSEKSAMVLPSLAPQKPTLTSVPKMGTAFLLETVPEF